MKNCIFLLGILFLCSCNQQPPKEATNTTEVTENTDYQINKTEVVEQAKKYLIKITPNPKLSSDNENIFIDNGDRPNGETDNENYYNYTFSKIDVLVGDLNGDNNEDAELHLEKSFGGNATISEQLIFLNQNGKLILVLHNENLSDVFFDRIKDGLLYGVQSKRDSEYNLVNKKVKYQLIENKLVELN